MSDVGPMESVRYGLRLMVHFIWISVVAALTVIWVIALLDKGDTAMAVLYAAGGGTIVLAGVLGLGYKVIADGVSRGTRAN